MKLGNRIALIIALGILLTACSSAEKVSIPLSLAAFTENDVEVTIHLERNANGETLLSATFTPPEGSHMYSKDIPAGGVEGLGRPTRLDLTADSQMKALGALTESVPAEEPGFEPKNLLVYPSGAVTLSLPVELPPGNAWVDDVVAVTYMACNGFGCKAPVIGKLVPVRVPGAGMVAAQK